MDDKTPEKADELAAIQKKLDGWLGMTSSLVLWAQDPQHHVELCYLSPTSVLLFKVELHFYRDQWHLASRSTSLPTGIDTLRTLIEPISVDATAKVDTNFQQD